VNYVHRKEERDAQTAFFNGDLLELTQRLSARNMKIGANLAIPDFAEFFRGEL